MKIFEPFAQNKRYILSAVEARYLRGGTVDDSSSDSDETQDPESYSQPQLG